jgi:hypothetical protein
MFQTEVVEKIKTHLMFNNLFSDNRAVYEIMWKNMVQSHKPQMTIWRMRIACCITKAKHSLSFSLFPLLSEYVILIVFPRRQCLRERTRMLRYTYLACLVSLYTTWK